MHHRRIVTTIVVAFALTVFAAPAHAETVTHWSDVAAAQLTPQGTLGILHMTMVHGAIYDAVNAIDGTHQPYLTRPAATQFDSQDAAVAAAAHDVLAGVLSPLPASVETEYMTALAAIPSGPAKTGGVSAGQAAAKAMLDARKFDGRLGSFLFTESTDIGAWRGEPPFGTGTAAVPANPWLKNVTPFTLRKRTQFSADKPYKLTSKRYAREFNEVKALGRATGSTRTQAQTDQANFWYPNPARLWSNIVRTIATQENLSNADAARYYAMTFMAVSDALINVWNDKDRFSFWRPVTAIHEAAKDDNALTTADPYWQPLWPTPPYPEHSSGHSTLAGAVTETAKIFFETDGISFTATNPVGGQTRSFTSLTQAVQEVIDGRILEGIHFRHSDEAGAKTGQQVAHWIADRFFQPVGGHDDGDDGQDDG
jgi:hypothetical protein